MSPVELAIGNRCEPDERHHSSPPLPQAVGSGPRCDRSRSGFHVVGAVQVPVEGLGRVPVAHVPVRDVPGLEGLGQVGVVGQLEAADEVFGEEEDGGKLVLAGLAGEPSMAQGDELIDRAFAEGVVVPEPAHALSDPGHRDPSEYGGFLEVALPVPAGGVVGGGGEELVEMGGDVVGEAHGRPASPVARRAAVDCRPFKARGSWRSRAGGWSPR